MRDDLPLVTVKVDTIRSFNRCIKFVMGASQRRVQPRIVWIVQVSQCCTLVLIPRIKNRLRLLLNECTLRIISLPS